MRIWIWESFLPWIWNGKQFESGIHIPDLQHCYYDRIEDPDTIACPLLKSPLLTVESGVVARVLEPGSGEASAQQTQVNHSKSTLMGFGIGPLGKTKMSAKKKTIYLSVYWSKRVRKKTGLGVLDEPY
jgi:hypothetical protein